MCIKLGKLCLVGKAQGVNFIKPFWPKFQDNT
jgi:hypothetical protein